MPTSTTTPSQFVLLTHQRGAETALKKEMARRRPNYRLSYSRPGFLTYKLPAPEALDKRLGIDVPTLGTIFARSCAHSLGSVVKKDAVGETGEFDSRRAAERVWELARSEFGSESRSALEMGRAGKELPRLSRVRVFERDQFEIGTRGYEPGPTDLTRDVHRAICEGAPKEFADRLASDADQPDVPAELGEVCLDVALVSPEEYWVGFHRVSDWHSRYPGGLSPLALPTDAASRAFLKFEEGLRWSGLPIGVGSRCVDIGSSPGGCSQALLARGAEVIGVDPAEMDPRVLAYPNFVHLRGKIGQLKRKSFRKSRWFFADMNVAPRYALDALEELISRPDVDARGALFTLKLFEWKLADEIPSYISRIKSWGFNRVKARQLQFNRQEIMIAATKKGNRRH
ncbi:MAG: hypothetical protein IJM30_09780 [Thermoguttaceae bacterium]|nr:hypothetical protein [Thermoguttaceae bacterium]